MQTDRPLDFKHKLLTLTMMCLTHASVLSYKVGGFSRWSDWHL